MGKSPGCYVSPGSFLSLGWGEHNLAGSDLIDRLIHDFEREILLAEAFARPRGSYGNGIPQDNSRYDPQNVEGS